MPPSRRRASVRDVRLHAARFFLPGCVTPTGAFQMTQTGMAGLAPGPKSMRLGELGLVISGVAMAALWTLITAKAYTPEYGFHAGLFAIVSIATVFAVINRYH